MAVKRKALQSPRDLDVYQMAFEAAMRVFELSRAFPSDERFALIDQIRRSSRAVCANIAEAWGRRRYEGAFLMRLNDAEAEVYETQTWLEFAVKCQYLQPNVARELYRSYQHINGKLVRMITNPEPWILPVRRSTATATPKP